MTFRARLTLVAAAAVALAVVAASLVVYFVVRDQLRGTVDDSLRSTAAKLTHVPPREFHHFAAPPGELGGAPAISIPRARSALSIWPRSWPRTAT